MYTDLHRAIQGRGYQNMKHSKVILIIAVLALFVPQIAGAAPFRNIDSLESLTFWEITGGVTKAFTFNVDSTQVLNRLTVLSPLSYDFYGVFGHELYDVFYSDADGTFNPNGEYLTIEGEWDRQYPAGGGLNLAEMGLNFSDGRIEYGRYVASYVMLGNNAVLSSIPYAVDGNLMTATIMGNTVGLAARLRLTLGFDATELPDSGVSPVPAPPALILLGSGRIGLMGLRKRFA